MFDKGGIPMYPAIVFAGLTLKGANQMIDRSTISVTQRARIH